MSGMSVSVMKERKSEKGKKGKEGRNLVESWKVCGELHEVVSFVKVESREDSSLSDVGLGKHSQVQSPRGLLLKDPLDLPHLRGLLEGLGTGGSLVGREEAVRT